MSSRRRSASTPVTEVKTADRPGRVPPFRLGRNRVHDENLGHTVATNDCSSIDGYIGIRDIRFRLMTASHEWAPAVVCEKWLGHIYVGCWLHPVNPPSAMLNPQRYHVTLTRIYMDPAMIDMLAGFMPGWNALLSGVFDACMMPFRDPMTHRLLLSLTPPPWRNSWTFGPPVEMHAPLLAVRDMAILLVRVHAARFMHLMVSDEDLVLPEFHVSWN